MPEIHEYICNICHKQIGLTDNLIGDDPDEIYHWTCFLGLNKIKKKRRAAMTKFIFAENIFVHCMICHEEFNPWKIFEGLDFIDDICRHCFKKRFTEIIGGGGEE